MYNQKVRQKDLQTHFNEKNEVVTPREFSVKLAPDHAKWHRIMTQTLQLEGSYLNHKKLLRLMK